MGFIAKKFSFNRVPCEEYGLRIFDIDGNDNEAAPFASVGELQTDVITYNHKENHTLLLQKMPKATTIIE